MADEANVAQGDTTATAGSSDVATNVDAQQNEPATNAVAPNQGAQTVDSSKDAGLLGGNNEGSEKAQDESKSTGEEGSEGESDGLDNFTLDESLGFGEDVQGFFKSQAKEAGFDQEQAQKAVDMFQNGFKAYRDEQVSKQTEAFDKFKADNAKEWEAKENSTELSLLADKAATKLGIRDYLVDTGYVYDAKLLSALAELGRFYSESTAITGGESGRSDKTPQEILWPDMNKQN